MALAFSAEEVVVDGSGTGCTSSVVEVVTNGCSGSAFFTGSSAGVCSCELGGEGATAGGEEVPEGTSSWLFEDDVSG